MATEVQIGGDGTLFVGEDKTLVLGPILDAAGVPVDVSSWAARFTVAVTDSSTTFLIDKTASVVGSYNAVVALNTQRLTVTLDDTDTDALKAKTYRHSWKRTTSGLETVLAYGDFVVEKATTP